MTGANERWICEECDWTGRREDLLSAPDPFNDGCLIYACPSCHLMTTTLACDVDGCKKVASCGEPTDQGYRYTCFEHAPGRVIHVPTEKEGA